MRKKNQGEIQVRSIGGAYASHKVAWREKLVIYGRWRTARRGVAKNLRTYTLYRALHDGRPVSSWCWRVLGNSPQCRRVYEQFHSFKNLRTYIMKCLKRKRRAEWGGGPVGSTRLSIDRLHRDEEVERRVGRDVRRAALAAVRQLRGHRQPPLAADGHAEEPAVPPRGR